MKRLLLILFFLLLYSDKIYCANRGVEVEFLDGNELRVTCKG